MTLKSFTLDYIIYFAKTQHRRRDFFSVKRGKKVLLLENVFDIMTVFKKFSEETFMKRIIACTLSIVMICMVWPIGVLAEEEQASTDFFGEAETVTNTAVEPDFESGANISRIDTVQAAPVVENKLEGVSDVVLTTAEYEAEMAKLEDGKTPEELAANKEYLTYLLRHRLVYKTGYDILIGKMQSDLDFKTAVEYIFSDYETLQYYIYGGEPDNWTYNGRTNVADAETYLKSLEIFSSIFKAHSNDITEDGTPTYQYTGPKGEPDKGEVHYDEQKLQNRGLFKRLMVSIALTHTSEIGPWNLLSPNRYKYNLYPKSDPVGRYELYKKLYIHNLLIADFDKYNVEELRMVVSVMMDNAQLEWMHYYYRTQFLKNTDYLTNPVPATEQNVSGWCDMTYRVYEAWPSQLGGVGDKYYAEENRDEYTKKYTLEMHDGAIFDYKIPYGPVNDNFEEIEETDINKGAKYYQRQWITIDAGFVCFGVSNTATVLRCAFGIPTVINEEPPNHCAYFEYHHKDIDTPVTPNSGNLTLSIEYDVYGITSAFPYFHRHTLTDWGSSYSFVSVRNGIYMVYGMDAIFGRLENTDNQKHETIMPGMSDYYLKAFNLRLMGDVQQKIGDEKAEKGEDESSAYETAIGLYETALTVQDSHFSAFIGLADCYKKMNKSDDDYVKLAEKAAESKMWLYAQPLSDYLVSYLVPLMESTTKKADVVFIAEEKLRDAQKLNGSNSQGLAQPSYSASMANYCLSQMKKVAAFTFESKSITISSEYAELTGFEYSVDGGNSWTSADISADTHSAALTEEDLARITVENGIQYKFGDSQKKGYIVFTKGAMPQSTPSRNTVDDNGDRFLNLEKGLEFSKDDENVWHDLTADSRFEGDVTVHVRRKASGTTLASDEFVKYFTQGDGTPDFSFLKTDNIQGLTVDAEPFEKNRTTVSCAWDGKNSTYFENNYASTKIGEAVVQDENKVRSPRQNFDFVFELKEPRYISGLGYLPGVENKAITGLELYVSADNETWQLVGSVDAWEEDMSEKLLKLAAPAYAKYIKIHTTAVHSEPHPLSPNLTVGHFTVAEFKLYENFAVNDKTPAALKLTPSVNFKSSYSMGDKPNLAGIRAELQYSDETTAIIPEGALECNVEIFDSIETKELTLSYEGMSATVPVTVAANDRTATEITSVTARDRKYYEGDTIDNKDIEVEVKNESETWYLLPDEFTVDGTLTKGENHLTVTVKDTELSGSFNVTAEGAVECLTIEKPDDFRNQYFIGDALELSGMKVNLKYKDGTERELTEDEYTLDLYMEKNPEIEAGDAPAGVVFEGENDERIIVPVDINDFGKTFGTVIMRVTLNDKADICAEEELTVFSYITDGEFSFDLIDENSCTLTGYDPNENMTGHTVTVPEKAECNGLSFDVTQIAANAFEDAPETETVSIPKTVGRIMSSAFAACNELKNIYMIYHDNLDDFVCEEGAFTGSGTVYLNSALAAEFGEDETPIPNYKVADISTSTQGIEITPPDKREYILNEDLDTTGMVVMAVLYDGSKVETQHYTVTYDKTRVNEKAPVTVAINGTDLSETFDINVKFPELGIVKQPVGGDYTEDTPMNSLTFEATAALNHTCYQWYKCESKEYNGTAIDGAEDSSYTPTEPGYYYAEAYVEDGDGKRSEPKQSEIVQITVSDYAAVTDGKGYSTLKEAMENAGQNSTVNLYKDVTLDETITLSGGKNITLTGNGCTVKRGNSANGYLFVLTGEKTTLTLRNVTIDGGAVWTGDVDPVLGHGAQNSGRQVSRPMIDAQAQTTLNLEAGAILQNNWNVENYYDHCAGAVNLNGANMTINGGVIRNNYANGNAVAVYLTNSGDFTSSLVISDGEISGNMMAKWPAWGGGVIGLNSEIYTQKGSTVRVTGGSFHNNKSVIIPNGWIDGDVSGGGVFDVNIGELTISGGDFYKNSVDDMSTDKNSLGGVITCSGGKVTISGGSFRENSARCGGAVGAMGSATVTISDGEFIDNTAKLGGALYYDSSSGNLSISNSVLKNNTADNGSAIYVGSAATLAMNGVSYEGNTANESGTVWTKGPINITNPEFKDNNAPEGAAIYTDYTNYTNTIDAITIFGLSDEMQDIYMKKFLPVSVYSDLTGKNLAIQTESDIDDDTDILIFMGRDTSTWTVNGTINGRALTERITEGSVGATVRRKPIAGTILSMLDGSVTEHGETFDEGFVTDIAGIDLTGCKSLAVTFAGGSEDSITVKYPLSKLFGNRFVNLESVKFGLVIKDIPMVHKNDTISIAFTDEEPNSDEVNTMLLKSRNMLGVKMGFDVDIVPEAEQEQKQESKPEEESETAYKEPEQ